MPCVVAPESSGSKVMSNSMLLAAGKHCWDWWLGREQSDIRGWHDHD
jgi:hypothetical protein